MSWAKVKKINSDMKLSLDELGIINTIDRIGSAYNFGSDVAKLNKFLASEQFFSRAVATGALVEEGITSADIRTNLFETTYKYGGVLGYDYNCGLVKSNSVFISALASYLTTEAKAGELIARILRSEDATLLGYTTFQQIAQDRNILDLLFLRQNLVEMICNSTALFDILTNYAVSKTWMYDNYAFFEPLIANNATLYNAMIAKCTVIKTTVTSGTGTRVNYTGKHWLNSYYVDGSSNCTLAVTMADGSVDTSEPTSYSTRNRFSSDARMVVTTTATRNFFTKSLNCAVNA